MLAQEYKAGRREPSTAQCSDQGEKQGCAPQDDPKGLQYIE